MSKKAARAADRLIETAIHAQKRAYCPYSRYPVGAAVLTKSGRVFAGCNVENASYGLAICAERVAIFHSVVAGHDALEAVAVVGAAAKPCGACRQVMFEFSDKDTALFLVDLNPTTGRRNVTRTTVYKMLPFAFDPLASGLLPQNPRNLLRRRAPARKGRPARRKARRR